MRTTSITVTMIRTVTMAGNPGGGTVTVFRTATVTVAMVTTRTITESMRTVTVTRTATSCSGAWLIGPGRRWVDGSGEGGNERDDRGGEKDGS